MGFQHIYCGTSTAKALLQRCVWQLIESIIHEGQTLATLGRRDKGCGGPRRYVAVTGDGLSLERLRPDVCGCTASYVSCTRIRTLNSTNQFCQGATTPIHHADKANRGAVDTLMLGDDLYKVLSWLLN